MSLNNIATPSYQLSSVTGQIDLIRSCCLASYNTHCRDLGAYSVLGVSPLHPVLLGGGRGFGLCDAPPQEEVSAAHSSPLSVLWPDPTQPLWRQSLVSTDQQSS